MFLPWSAFLPVLLVIFIFLFLRRITWALFFGSLLAAAILSDFSLSKTIMLLFNKTLESTQINNLFSKNYFTSPRLLLMSFIIGINILIGLIHRSGIFYGYYNFFHKKIKNKTAAEASCIFLGFLLFVDDYLNVMTNSRVSTMLSQGFHIPRLKICFLISCIAAPLCTLIPISSWSAEIISIFSGSMEGVIGPKIEPFMLLTSSAFFVYFSIFMILAAIMTVLFKFSFGRIYKEELRELKVYHDQTSLPDHVWEFTLFHFLSPILLLVSMIILNMLWFGGFFSGVGFWFALKTNPFPEKALFFGTFQAIVLILTVFFTNKILRFRDFIHAIEDGLSESKNILLLLFLSNLFGKFVAQLGLGFLLADLLLPTLSVSFLPAVIFLIATLISLLLGSSWATMTVLLPIGIPLANGLSNSAALSFYPLIFIVVGAILSGAVFGSSLSPAADLLLMNTKGCRVDQIDFLQVQWEMLLPVGLSTLISFLAAGYFAANNWTHLIAFWSGLIGFVALIIFYWILSNFAHKKNFET